MIVEELELGLRISGVRSTVYQMGQNRSSYIG
jgi:hypothetical protein